MKSSKLIEVMKQGNLVIPLYLFQTYKKWNLSLEEFIFLMYLYNQGEKFIFDPQGIAQKLHLELAEVMELISVLTDKHYIRVEVIRNDKKIMEEYVNMEDFYHKLSLLVMEEVVLDDTPVSSTIYELIEKEFGRTLSSMEYEIIKAWLDNHIQEDLIKAALKEATFNGVSNLRYIDKILYEWGKKGIVSKEDVLKYQTETKYHREKKEAPEVFDYDWFDDDGE